MRAFRGMDCDVARKDGKYYMYFPLKDQNDIFRIGVAISDNPEGPFVPQANPMKGSYSIDPAILDNGDGDFYMYFGGLWGGQLQRYRDNKALECAVLPEGDEQALPARVAKLSKDMLEFAEEPKAVVILDENGSTRFNQLARQIPDISTKVLSNTLQILEADGLVKRTVFPEVPIRVEYELTATGKSLVPIIVSLTEWAQNNMQSIMEHRKKFESLS